jgi:hypothetical protein
MRYESRSRAPVSQSTYVQIPMGATKLLLSVNDILFEDNGDPNNNFGVYAFRVHRLTVSDTSSVRPGVPPIRAFRDNEVTSILDAMSHLLMTRDLFAHGTDHPCAVGFVLSGNVIVQPKSYPRQLPNTRVWVQPTIPPVINSPADMFEHELAAAGTVRIVDGVDFCESNHDTGYSGCAYSDYDYMVVERTGQMPWVTWAHELGHLVDLGNLTGSKNARYLMYDGWDKIPNPLHPVVKIGDCRAFVHNEILNTQRRQGDPWR